MADELVHVAVDDGVATITLDSPANRNALSTALVAGLASALDRAEAGVDDGSVRAIVLTHSPPAFCAGADLKERRAGPPDSSPFVDVLQRLMDAEVPTIAAVEGPARAGGIGLMAACDLIVVRRDITFALTEVRIGVAAAIISVPILRRADAGRLAAAFLTGEPFDAAAARDAGLVTHVTDDVAATVAGLCDGHPHGRPACRRRDQADAPHGSHAGRDEAFARMRALSDALFTGPDAAEGMAAFAEKRPPSWQSRLITRPSARRRSMSSSETSTRLARVGQRHERVLPGDAHDRHVDTRLDEPADDGLADAAAAARLVDDHHPPGRAGVAGDLVDRQRRQPAQVEHAAVDAVRRQPLGDAQRHVQAVAPRDDEHVVTVAHHVRRPDRHMLAAHAVGWRVRGDPALVAAARADRGCGRGRSARGTR